MTSIWRGGAVARFLLNTWRRWSGRGAMGERCAARFLQRKGLRVIARGWRSPRDRRDELDLVCREGEALVFVEVKTRDAAARVSGYYAVDRRKKAVVRRAATAYLRGLATNDRPLTVRFDVVEVAMTGRQVCAIRHFENVPLPGFRWAGE